MAGCGLLEVVSGTLGPISLLAQHFPGFLVLYKLGPGLAPRPQASHAPSLFTEKSAPEPSVGSRVAAAPHFPQLCSGDQVVTREKQFVWGACV